MVAPNYTNVINPVTSASAARTYHAIVQHIRTMTKKETYSHLANVLGFEVANIRAAFIGLKKFIRNNSEKSNLTQIDGVASIRNKCCGSFASSKGPWVKGKNYVAITAVELDPFKSSLAGIVPVNKTDGAKPTISSVLDNVTKVYDIIAGTNAFTVAGTDLGPDTEADDEYVGFINDETNERVDAVIDESTLQTVKAHLESALTPGKYTLVVSTRSGYGSEGSLHTATRKITIA